MIHPLIYLNIVNEMIAFLFIRCECETRKIYDFLQRHKSCLTLHRGFVQLDLKVPTLPIADQLPLYRYNLQGLVFDPALVKMS